MATFSLSWALLVLIPLVAAGPLSQKGCMSECTIPAKPKFQNVVGKTYTYDYQTSSLTSMLGVSEESAAINIKGQLSVTFHDSCNLELVLSAAMKEGSKEKVDLAELELRSFMVSWHDGVIESVCFHNEEPAWTANIKRAVASMLQHTPQFLEISQNNVEENDIIGRCPTNYTTHQFDDMNVVVKTKSQNQCSNRVDRQSSIPSVPYFVPAEIQTIPLLNSSYVCTQQIKAGIITGVSCREDHVFRPLSTENGGGAKTIISSTLALATTENAIISKASDDLKASELFFDASGLRFDLKNAKDINSVVRNICQSLASDNPVVVTQHFTELVYAMRKASPKEVKDAYNNVKGKKVCAEAAKTEKLFLDALPQAGTVGTISLMANILIGNNQLSERQVAGWYVSLPLAKYATVEAIKPFITMVDSLSTSSVALFGITGMVRRICSKNFQECVANKDIQQLSIAINRLLGNKCQVQPKDESQVLLTLKALGNMGIVANEVQTTVNQCAKDVNLPIALRLAAIEVSRHNSCAQQVHNLHLDLLGDRNQDSEVRIAAFLSAMRCPSYSSMQRIREIMSEEENNQVGSYIVSYLNNLESSPTPARQHVRRLFKKMTFLKHPYPIDLLKYSRNLVSNHFCAAHNAGWELDANIMYSTKSFLPRSASLNMSVDLFGQSFNLFEFGVRAENLERILEDYIGPNGSVQKEGVVESLKKTSDAINEMADNIAEGVSSIIRPKRALIKANDVNALDKPVNMKDRENVKIDAFMRVFGADTAMYNYRGSSGQKTLGLMEGMQSQITNALKDLIQGAKNVNVDIARSLMFLDSSVAFPTVAGFPLRLAVNGTATMALGMESKMDIPSIFKNPQNAEMKLKLSPLSVTELAGAMTVDIGAAKTGVKLLATIHSSFAVDLTAKSSEGSNIDIKLDLPKSKITLVDVKSEVLLVQQNTHKKMKMSNEASYTQGGCSDYFNALTGMRVCAQSTVTKPNQVSGVTPSFPLSGNVAISIFMQKTDPSMKGYSFSLNTKQSAANTKSVSLVVDTPGSKTNRKLSFKGTIATQPNLNARIEARAPWGQVVVEGRFSNEQTAQLAEMKVISGTQEYMGSILLAHSRAGPNIGHTATIRAMWPGQAASPIFEVQLGYGPEPSFKLSMKPVGPFANMPYSIALNLATTMAPEANLLTCQQLELVTPLGAFDFSGDIGRMDRTHLVTANVKYGTEKQHSRSFDLRTTEKFNEPDDIFVYSTSLTTSSSRFPDSDLAINWDSIITNQVLSNDLNVKRGDSVFSLKQNSSLFFIPEFSLKNQFEVAYPKYNIDTKFNQNFEFVPEGMKGMIRLSESGNDLLNGDFMLETQPKDPNTIYNLNAKIMTPSLSVAIRDSGKLSNSGAYSFTPVLEMTPGGSHRMVGKFRMGKDDSFEWSADTTSTFQGIAKPAKFHHDGKLSLSDSNTKLAIKNHFEMNGQRVFNLDATLAVVDKIITKKSATKSIKTERTSIQFDMDLNLVSMDRRVKLNKVLTVDDNDEQGEDDAFSGSLSLAWDADKDRNKQVSIEFSAIDQRGNDFELKVIPTIMSDRYAATLNVKFPDDDTEMLLLSVLEYPSGQNASLRIENIDISNKENATFIIGFEATLTNGDIYGLRFKHDEKNNFSENTFRTDNEFIIQLAEFGKVEMALDRNRVDEVRKINANIVVSPHGQKLKMEQSLAITLDHEDTLHANAAFNYGAVQLEIDVGGKIVVIDNKDTLTGSFVLTNTVMPFRELKIDLLHNGHFTSPYIYDISERLVIAVDEFTPIEFYAIINKNTAEISRDMIHARMELSTPFETVQKLTSSARFGMEEQADSGNAVAAFSGDWRAVDDTFSLTSSIFYSYSDLKTEGGIAINLGHSGRSSGSAYQVELDMVKERGNDFDRFKLSLKSDIDMVPPVELRFERRQPSANVAEIEIAVSVAKYAHAIQSMLKLRLDAAGETDFDLTISLPSSRPMSFTGRAEYKYPAFSIDSRADWGSGKAVVKGSSNFIHTNMFDATLFIDIPTMGIDQREVQIINEQDSSKGRIEFIVKKRSKTTLSFKYNHEVKQKKNGGEVKGSLNVSAALRDELESLFTTKFTFEGKGITGKGDESGYEYKLKADNSYSRRFLPSAHFLAETAKLESTLKLTNKEESLTVNVANKKKEFIEAVFACKDKSTGSTSSSEALALWKTKFEGVLDVGGFRFKQSSAGMKFEHTGEWIVDEAKGHIMGYKLYKKDGEHGVQVFTPNRVVAAVLEKVKGLKQSSKHVLSVWLDKSKAVDNRLIITTNYEPQKFNDMEGFAASIHVRHPKLTKTLEYKLECHKGWRQNLFHAKVDMDVFDATHQRWTLETNVKKTTNLTIETQVHSQGANIGAKLLLHGSVDSNELVVGADLQFLDHDEVTKELFVDIKADDEAAIVRVGSPSNVIVFQGRYDFEDLAGNPRIQITGSSQVFSLPVMSFVTEINNKPLVNMRVFQTKTPQINYQINGGNLDGKYQISMTRQTAEEKKDLFGAYVNYNSTSSDVIQGRLTWDVEAIRQFMQTGQSRFMAVASEVQSKSEILSEELENIAAKWEAFGNFESDYASFVNMYSKQWAELVQDITNHESFKTFRLDFDLHHFLVDLAVRITTGNSIEDIKWMLENWYEGLNLAYYKWQIKSYINDVLQSTSESFLHFVNYDLYFMFARFGRQLLDIPGELAEIAQSYRGYLGEWEDWEPYFVRFFSFIEDIQNFNDFIEAKLRMYTKQIVSPVLDESFFNSAEEILISFTGLFPTTSRFVHANIISPLKKVKSYLHDKNMPTPNMNKTGKKPSLLGDFTVFDIENGEIQYELPLSAWVTLLDQIFENIFKLVTYADSLVVDSSKESTDWLNQMRVKYSPEFLIPRMRGYASIISTEGIVTFDNTYYTFYGDCQYLLARDFLQKDFTIAVNYGWADEKNIKTMIFADMNDQVEIKIKDGSHIVLINNKATKQFPVTLKNIIIEQEGNVVTVSRSHGAVLRCNAYSDICTFQISPFYKGRVMGLWGTFNNEDADEYTLPNGKVAKDLENFTKNWKLNKSCKDNALAYEPNTTTGNREEQCKRLFRAPNLRACSELVSIEPYETLCKQVSFPSFDTVSASTNAYIGACKRLGVPLNYDDEDIYA